MTRIFIVDDAYEATRIANGLKALGVDIELDRAMGVYRIRTE